MTTNAYDAIIVGASFAGLAVARRLRGRILLLDRRSGCRMERTGRAACGDTRVMMQRQSAVRPNPDWDFHRA
jgi:flavin-dependent dehydrogenase